jgi:predicted phosphohydrolase
LITTLKEREICNLKQAAKDRGKRRSRVRSIPDKADLEALRASKEQRREEMKLEIIQERQEKAYNAELTRLKLATARESMPAHQRDIKRLWEYPLLANDGYG